MNADFSKQQQYLMLLINCLRHLGSVSLKISKLCQPEDFQTDCIVWLSVWSLVGYIFVSKGTYTTVALEIPQLNWNLEVLVFVEGGKPENQEKNPRSKERTNNKFNPHMTPGLSIEPGPH